MDRGSPKNADRVLPAPVRVLKPLARVRPSCCGSPPACQPAPCPWARGRVAPQTLQERFEKGPRHRARTGAPRAIQDPVRSRRRVLRTTQAPLDVHQSGRCASETSHRTTNRCGHYSFARGLAPEDIVQHGHHRAIGAQDIAPEVSPNTLPEHMWLDEGAGSATERLTRPTKALQAP